MYRRSLHETDNGTETAMNPFGLVTHYTRTIRAGFDTIFYASNGLLIFKEIPKGVTLIGLHVAYQGYIFTLFERTAPGWCSLSL